MNRSIRNLLGFLLFVTAQSSLFGCAPPPSVSPFVEATNDLRSSIFQVGLTTGLELQQMEIALAGMRETESESAGYSERFERQWQARVAVLDAMVDYANSLQAIASAAQQGRASANGLANEIIELAQAAGVPIALTGTTSLITDAGKEIYSQIVLVKAATSLQEALSSSQPAVQMIVQKIALDMEDAETVFLEANDFLSGLLEIQHADALQFRQTLLAEQKRIYQAGLGALDSETSDKFFEIQKLIDATDYWYRPLSEQIKNIQKRGALGQKLFATTQFSIKQWGAAHFNLVLAVKENRPVNTESLVQATVDLRALIQRMNDL